MSDAITALRSRPVIILTSFITVNPPVIPLNSSGLHCQQENFNPCTTVSLCFNYTGTDVPASVGMVKNNIMIIKLFHLINT